jgi:beta-mannosidase
VGKKSWTYRSKLPTPSVPQGATCVLAFDGLDTFADVRLNGKTILRSDNMHLRHRVDITHAMQAETNELEIEFDSALLKARDIEKQHPDHKYICFNGDPSRLAVRKAQCHWGWDWGPIIMCAGVWRPVRLEVYHARIADIRTEQTISKDYKSATVNVKAEVEGEDVQNLEARISISLDGKTIKEVSTSVSSDGTVSADLVVDAPSLWMPNGYGEQKLYDVKVLISADHDSLHSDARRIGIRKVELIQEPDQSGKSFYFRINSIDVFCGGSCWIPSDSILTNVTPGRLKAWIELLVPANQKMIRLVLLKMISCNR